MTSGEGSGSLTHRVVRVGVIDSGWDASIHDDRVERGFGVTEHDRQVEVAAGATDCVGHGTMCIGLILARAPTCQVLPVRIFEKRLEASPRELIAAIRLLTSQNVDIISMSLGTLREDVLQPLYTVCELAKRKGTLLIAAAHFSEIWSYPAVFDNVLGVTGSRFASDSSFAFRAGHAIECVAHGEARQVRTIQGRRLTAFSSSFAAANMSGIVARFLSRFAWHGIDVVRSELPRFAVREDTHGVVMDG